MLTVKIYEQADDARLKFAVILTRYRGQWVFCKHKQRDTWEMPGGHREPGETILEAARRELQEESGAEVFTIEPLFCYSTTGKSRVVPTGEETFGQLFYAEVERFAPALHSEMERIGLFDDLPAALTYPDIQPLLMEEFLRRRQG